VTAVVHARCEYAHRNVRHEAQARTMANDVAAVAVQDKEAAAICRRVLRLERHGAAQANARVNVCRARMEDEEYKGDGGAARCSSRHAHVFAKLNVGILQVVAQRFVVVARHGHNCARG